jgi:membrane carboxypeptidase/penicillin-binding protein
VQGALLAIDNSTGEIKAMVGGYDWTESKYNRAVQAERQVGSSFKVYVYAQAITDGTSPFDTVVDLPVSYRTSSGVWAPHNYDDKFEGTITALHALAESRNVPAVRTLARIGVDKVIKLCRKFGLTSRLVPNLPLALGASDLTLLEHTSAFTTFPNDGVHIAPRSDFRKGRTSPSTLLFPDKSNFASNDRSARGLLRFLPHSSPRPERWETNAWGDGGCGCRLYWAELSNPSAQP